MPDTGGVNIPALNELLFPWGVAFGDIVYDGDFTIGKQTVTYASGTHIARFPPEGVVVAANLNDQGILSCYNLLL